MLAATQWITRLSPSFSSLFVFRVVDWIAKYWPPEGSSHSIDHSLILDQTRSIRAWQEAFRQDFILSRRNLSPFALSLPSSPPLSLLPFTLFISSVRASLSHSDPLLRASLHSTDEIVLKWDVSRLPPPLLSFCFYSFNGLVLSHCALLSSSDYLIFTSHWVFLSSSSPASFYPRGTLFNYSPFDANLFPFLTEMRFLDRRDKLELREGANRCFLLPFRHLWTILFSFRARVTNVVAFRKHEIFCRRMVKERRSWE